LIGSILGFIYARYSSREVLEMVENGIAGLPLEEDFLIYRGIRRMEMPTIISYFVLKMRMMPYYLN
jgi:hypothetical protein